MGFLEECTAALNNARTKCDDVDDVSSDSIKIDFVGPEADVENVAKTIQEAGKLEMPTFGSISFEDAEQTKQEGATDTPSDSETSSESSSDSNSGSNSESSSDSDSESNSATNAPSDSAS